MVEPHVYGAFRFIGLVFCLFLFKQYYFPKNYTACFLSQLHVICWAISFIRAGTIRCTISFIFLQTNILNIWIIIYWISKYYVGKCLFSFNHIMTERKLGAYKYDLVIIIFTNYIQLWLKILYIYTIDFSKIKCIFQKLLEIFW